MKYLQNEARKQKSVKEVTPQFSMIFQIRLKNNTVNFRVICPLSIRQWERGCGASAERSRPYYAECGEMTNGC